MESAKSRATRRLQNAPNYARGWVYVMSNPAMPGLVKIGFSLKDPDLRAAELNHTGVPHQYKIDCDILVTAPKKLEALTHQYLAQSSEGKEWFRISPHDAFEAILDVIEVNGDVFDVSCARTPVSQAIPELSSPTSPAKRCDTETRKFYEQRQISTEKSEVDEFWEKHMP
jgi:hypothetical protein